MLDNRTAAVIPLILGASLLTVGLAPAAGGQLPSVDVFIYDDGDFSASQAAAQNLAIPHEATDDPCELAEVAESAEANLLVVNSIFGSLSGCDEEIYQALADYAEGPDTLIFQSWEIGICDREDLPWEIPCDGEHAQALFDALGVEFNRTNEDVLPLETTETTNLCNAAPNPLLPAGVDRIEAGPSGAVFNSHGVTPTEAVACMVDTDTGDAQMTVHPNGVYIGFHPQDYQGSQDTTLPGPEDMVKLYENILTSNLP